MGHLRDPQLTDTPVSLDQQVFRDVIGRFATGVTVITTSANDKDFGTTASAVSSLSVDPPMLLICLNRESETQHAILDAGRFVVNILNEAQTELAARFATKHPTKFRDGDTERGASGLPTIAGALAVLECRAVETVTGGTHTVFLAEVEHATAMDGDPLAYYRGRFGRFEDALQEGAYRLLRSLVLRREVNADEALDIERLIEDLELDRQRIYHALTRLETEGLVARHPDLGFVVTPLRARDADEALQTRAIIEGGVAEVIAGGIDQAALVELRSLAAQANDSVDGPWVDYEQLGLASRSFHRKFVALAGNELLDEIYARLRIDAIWMKFLRHQDGPRHVDPRYLQDLVDACAAGDSVAAKRILFDHAVEAREVARQAIERAGGAV